MSMSVDEGGWERESDSERTPTHSVLYFFFSQHDSQGVRRNDGRFFQMKNLSLSFWEKKGTMGDFSKYLRQPCLDAWTP